MNARLHTVQKSAFTLVELLVVIGIIALLAALILPAISTAIGKAEKNRAMGQMKDIENAIRSYYQVYNRMPTYIQNGQPDTLFGGKNLPENRWQCTLMYPLRAISHPLYNAADRQNAQKKVFLEVPEDRTTYTASLSGDNNSYAPADNYYLDPWGNPYYVILDTDRDERISGFVPSIPYAEVRDVLNGASPMGDGSFPGVKIGVMSFGPKPGTAKSFMRSW